VDHRAYRTESRAKWGAAAAGWRSRADQIRDIMMPVSVRMLDAIAPQPGHRVLELAAGTGDTGFMAAELIAPGGELITSDFAPEMLRAAQERAESLGLTGVRFKQIDAESIDVETATLDAVLCRFGFMLMADPEAALRETRRVLKPGGRVALAVWSATEENPWNTLAARELVRRGILDKPAPGEPGPFTWSDPAAVEEHLAGAGFVDGITVEPVDFSFDYPDVDAWWSTMIDMSQRFSGALRAADPREEAEARASVIERAAPFIAADGSVSLPARALVATAVA